MLCPPKRKTTQKKKAASDKIIQANARHFRACLHFQCHGIFLFAFLAFGVSQWHFIRLRGQCTKAKLANQSLPLPLAGNSFAAGHVMCFYHSNCTCAGSTLVGIQPLQITFRATPPFFFLLKQSIETNSPMACGWKCELQIPEGPSQLSIAMDCLMQIPWFPHKHDASHIQSAPILGSRCRPQLTRHSLQSLVVITRNFFP